MTSSQAIQRAAWAFLGLSVIAFISGAFLARNYLCQPQGPNAFLAALLLVALAFLLFIVQAIQRRSFLVGGGALLVALLAFAMWVVAVAMTLPGCSGV